MRDGDRMIASAREFIEQRVLRPALDSTSLDEKTKGTIRNTASWLPRFERIGDLVAYMDRFKGAADTPIYHALKKAGLRTFEDIHGEFMVEFGAWATERTRLDDFIVGQRYTGSHLVIFAGVYDNRSGGILRIGKGAKPQAVFVKATFSGGKYANEWVDEGTRLKYYLKSRGDLFNERFVENAAIINNPEVPVFVFHRRLSTDAFTFAGAFTNAGVQRETDGSKWFDLVLASGQRSMPPVDEQACIELLRAGISKSLSSARSERLGRLAAAPKRALQITTVSRAYLRNPDVVAEVLYRAAGACEGCAQPAPFLRTAGGTPYLEVHHRIRLSEGGEDTVENAIALCPNCHRQEHFGPRKWQ